MGRAPLTPQNLPARAQLGPWAVGRGPLAVNRYQRAGRDPDKCQGAFIPARYRLGRYRLGRWPLPAGPLIVGRGAWCVIRGPLSAGREPWCVIRWPWAACHGARAVGAVSAYT